ncbi:MAG: site-specific DNA-methyltransferase [Thermoguttaceae bacterium]|nr:site-specific DNA-methyltransferase [Thermoguttaceae bacterium]
MDKLKMHTPDLTAENFRKLAELFPNAVTETIDENGEVVRAIDADVLRQEISAEVVEGMQERYQFTWPDKKRSVILANQPIAKTLRLVREKSVGRDGTPGSIDTENVYIEGDNLDALKLLQETYLGKVKMIYIDPPYNTGNDFIYEDDFSQETGEYLAGSGQYDEEGNRLVQNTESNGRFHTDWLNMLYPRLRIAKDFLSNDGVIFISIDDNELENLKKICNEIFGSQNFYVQIIWKKRSTPPNDQIIGAQHEYILVYAKNIELVFLNLRERTEEQKQRYKNPDNHPKGPWVAGDLSANVKGGRYVASLYYPIINPNTGEECYPPHDGNWRFNREKVEQLLANNEIYFGEDGCGRPKLKRFLSDVKQGITYTSLWDFVPLNTAGSVEMSSLLGNLAVFDNPKPVGLIGELLKLGSNDGDIILDFFSGSATTAHAVIQRNSEDGGHRKFILVQLPEVTDDKSEARKAGFSTICDIGEERIRRAGKKIREESPLTTGNLDIGFRVFRIDSTNMKDVYYRPQDFKQGQFKEQSDNVKDDRTPEDLLFQVMLDLGIPLSSKIEETVIEGKKVFFVPDRKLIACFDKEITDKTVKAIAKKRPDYAIFRDGGINGDSVMTNFEQIFETYSPRTRRKVL